MNCNCLLEIREKLKNELPEKNPNYANMKIISVSIDGECFLYSENKMVTGLSIPATIKHEPIGKKKSTTINLTASYCPFCGEECEK